MQGRHFDYECKQIVDKRAQGFVHHFSPGQMGDGLKLVVDEKLWGHKNEPKRVYKTDCSRQNPRVEPLVFVVEERINCVCNQKWVQSNRIVGFIV